MASRRKFVWPLLAAVLVLGLVAPQAFAKAAPGCEAASTLVKNGSCSYIVTASGPYASVGVDVSGVMADGGFNIYVDGALCDGGAAVASVGVDGFGCFKNVSPGFHVVKMIVYGVTVLRATSGLI